MHDQLTQYNSLGSIRITRFVPPESLRVVDPFVPESTGAEQVVAVLDGNVLTVDQNCYMLLDKKERLRVLKTSERYTFATVIKPLADIHGNDARLRAP